MIAPKALALSSLAGVAFASVVAGVYWLVRRRDPAAKSNAIKIFVALALIVAIRVYALSMPE